MSKSNSKIKRRTLLIGLGGTGTKTLERFREQLQRVDLLDNDENLKSDEPVRMLAIYTDESDRTNPAHGRWRNDVFLQLDQTKVEEKIQNLHEPININYKEWFPDPNREFIKAKQAQHGAGQWRPLGRLAFIEDQQRVEQKITEALEELMSLSTDGLDSMDIDVCIISSLGGGTGSGMLIDVAYFFRRFKIKLKGSTRINTFCYLLLPGAFKTQETGKRVDGNSFGALKEINTFYLQLADFEMNYPHEGRAFLPKGSSIPFTAVFLFDKELSYGESLPDANACYDFIGSVIYLKLVSPVDKGAKAVFANEKIPKAHSTEDKKTLLERGYIYSTCSGSIIELPDDQEVERLLKESLMEQIVHDQTSDTSYTLSDFKANLSDFDSHNDLFFYQELWKEITEKCQLPVLDNLTEILRKASESENYQDYERHMDEAEELVIEQINISQINSGFDEILEKRELARTRRMQILNSILTNEANKVFQKIKTDIEEMADRGHPSTRLKHLKARINILQTFIDEETPKNDDLGSYVLIIEKLDHNLSELIEKLDKLTTVIKELQKRRGKIQFGILSPLKKELNRRFTELNMDDLSKLKDFNWKQTSEESIVIQLKGYLYHELIEKHLKPLIATYSKKLAVYKSFDHTLEKVIAQDRRENGPLHQKRITQSHTRNESVIDLSKSLNNLSDWFDERVNEFWDSIDGTEESQDLNTEHLKAKIEEYAHRTVIKHSDVWRKELKEIDYTDQILKTLNSSKVSVFTNTETHANSSSRVFWSMPSISDSHLFLGTKKAQMKLHEAIERNIDETFSDAVAQKIAPSKNQFVVYYESHFHPAYNIRGIRFMRDEYYGNSFGPELFHIHKEYAKFPDPITREIMPRIVLCGNPGCYFDIANIPRHVNVCPNCNGAILNRCGNGVCPEDNLLKKIGGLREYAKAKHCPNCRNRITSYKWQCGNGHGDKLRTPRDFYCQDCNEEWLDETMKLEDRSKRSDDIHYPLLCIGCREQGKGTPLHIPAPEYVMGVPSTHEAYVRDQLARAGIPDNTCYICASKIYPECPHSAGEIHFVELGDNGLLTCHRSDTLHKEEVDFMECHNCHYPVKWEEGKSKHDCPRCHRELNKCPHCSDVERQLIDSPTLDNRGGKCPVCHYKIKDKDQ